jgi:hypothetical protein
MASQADAGAVTGGQPGDRLPAPGLSATWPLTSQALAALEPPERLAFTVAASQVARDENPGINTTAALVLTIQRLITEAASSPPVAADPDLGRIAYEAEGAWLDEFAPGSGAPWGTVDPVVRELYQRMAGMVARAVRGRAEAAEAKLAAIVAYCQAQADDFNATMPMRVRPQDIRVGARGILAITGTEGTQERDEKGPGHG